MKLNNHLHVKPHFFDCLHQLHDPKAKQYIEWSVTLAKDKFEFRHKPTLYMYPTEDLAGYKNLNHLLYELDCPEHLIRIQKNSFATAMYQGIRIPRLDSDEKCLYIHHDKCSHIDCYRWKNHLDYDKCNYFYHQNLDLNATISMVHSDLNPFLEQLTKAEQFDEYYGVWLQKGKNGISEIYYSFPNRSSFSWVAKTLENLLNQDVYEKSLAFGNIKFKNIGFDSASKSSFPAITVYYTFPISKKIPSNDKELIGDCFNFFENN